MRILPLILALAFAAVYATEDALYRDYNLDEFQVATAYLKDRAPDLYPQDFIWAKPEMIRNLHVCVRGLMRGTELLSFGVLEEPIDLYLIWLPVGVICFFLGTYLLSFRFTQDARASILVACCFMVVRRALWDWWGIGPMYTMSARGLVLSVLPLGLWSYFRFERSLPHLAICFFIWGILCNLHPLSGWGFVEFLGLTILIVERFRPRAWMKVFIMGGMTLLGSIPFIIAWKQVVVIPASSLADPAIIKQCFAWYAGIGAPPAKYVKWFFEDIAIPLLLAVIGYWVWKKRRARGDFDAWRIFLTFPCVIVAMTVIVILVGRAFRASGVAVPVVISEHGRNFKMVYLSLPVFMAFAFHGWLSLWHNSRHRVIKWAPAILVVILALIINFPGHKLARDLLHRAGWLPEKSARRYVEGNNEDAADKEVALWARAQTPADALFYFDSYEFRYYARRSLVFCVFDRPCVAYHPTRELEEWIRRQERVVPLKALGDVPGMLKAAHEYKAAYVVALKSWKQPEKKPIWSNAKYWVYAVE